MWVSCTEWQLVASGVAVVRELRLTQCSIYLRKAGVLESHETKRVNFLVGTDLEVANTDRVWCEKNGGMGDCVGPLQKQMSDTGNRKHSWAAECNKSIALSRLAELPAHRNIRFSGAFGFSTQQKKCLSSSLNVPGVFCSLNPLLETMGKPPEFKQIGVDSSLPGVAASAEVTEQCIKNLRLCWF